MQLCDKLCKKIFHSSFGRSEFEENTDIQNIQLISSTQINTDINQPITAELQVPSVNLIQSTPIQSPTKSKSSEDLRVDIIDTEVLPHAEYQDADDIVLDIEEQDHQLEQTSEQHIPDYKLESDKEMTESKLPDRLISDEEELEENEKVLAILDKSTEEELQTNDDEDKDDKESNNSPEDDNESSPKGTFDEEGYDDLDDNSKRLATKYGDLGGELILLNIPNPRLSNCTLGLKLSGNKNLNTMGIFICQITPNSLADIDGRLNVGDEILEVDEHILYGRSHLNASPIIRACNGKVIKFVIHRSDDWITSMAIPITYRVLEDTKSNVSSRRGSAQEFLDDTDYSQSRKTSSASLNHIPNSIPPISTEEAHTIYLNKGSQGFGFAIMEGSFTNEKGIFIKHIAPSGPAAQDGSLHPGDKLVSINNQPMLTASYDTALELLKNCKNQVRLVVTRVRCSYSPTHANNFPVKPLYQKRLSAPHIMALPIFSRAISPTIIEEKPEHHGHGISIKTIPESESGLTTLAKTITDLSARRRSSLTNLPNADIVTMIMNHLTEDENVEVVKIQRNQQPLGISIIGGSDTFIGDVIVHDIFCNGIIANDGRVKVGDKIVMVNNVSVVDCTNDEVITLLQSSCPEIILKIRHPDSPILDQDIYEVVTTVELVKKPAKGLGISVIGREGAKGVYVCDVVKGGVADGDGRLQPGDQILEINGEDFRNSTQEETAMALKFLMGSVVFKIGRIQKMNSHYTPTYLVAKENNGGDHGKSLGKHLTHTGPGHSPSRHAMASPAHAR